MAEPLTDPRHFTKAVTELGAVRPVVVTHPIISTKGVKIVDKGVALNPGLYERLMQHQLSSPLIDSVASTTPVTGRLLRDSAAELMRTAPLFALIAPEDGVRKLLLGAVERVPLPDPIAFQLTLASETRPELYQHLLFNALVAAWLAIDARISRFNVNIAATAGLLHDIGMLHLDPQLLDYKSDINRAQRRQLYSHPLVSATLIEVHPEVPREVVRAVLEHHEFLDGSGYPRNLAGSQIGHVGRILALSELIVGAFAAGREAPQLRLSILLRMNMHRYDEALAAKVIGVLRASPDVADSSISLLEDPVAGLLAIDRVLAAWPAHLTDRAEVSPQRRETLAVLSGQVLQLHRTLARVGAAPQQLTQLGGEPLGVQLQTELTLLAGEAAWQLRTLAREVGRRWHAESGSSLPEDLQQWLDEVIGVVSQVSGSHPGKGDDDDA
jgi:hypothetical protein